jgi:beta-aspartyl-peptidase (threonine type)
MAALLIVAVPYATNARSYRHFIEGSASGVAPSKVEGGLLLMGGGDRNLDAMRWFFAKAGHGHIVILRASQKGEIGKEFVREIGGILSAETFVILDRSAAFDPKVLAALRGADGIFLSGGDQARYVRRWRGTPIAEILDAHVAAGKPLGGTSAGLAVLGEYLYGAMDDRSITSEEAIADPFGAHTTIERDFLHLALLRGIITDTHFKERNRLGRLFAFVAKAQSIQGPGVKAILGLGIDENTAMTVEPDGTGHIYAETSDGGAWLVDGKTLRITAKAGPLQATSVQVTGIGPSTLFHLPDGKVERPTFVRDYAVVGNGVEKLRDAPLP